MSKNNDIFYKLNDDAFLESKFDYLNKNKELYKFYNIKDFQNMNDIDFISGNHINDSIKKNGIIDYNKIINHLKNNNINLPLTTIMDFFNTYLLHNNVINLSEQQILANFLKMIKFYDQFYKRKTPVYNDKKQTRITFIEDKHSEMDNNLKLASGFSKAMNFHNKEHLTFKKF